MTDGTRVGEQQLLRELGALTGDLDLGRVLEGVVTTARRLVQARYAALGILGADGTLVAFVHEGMEPDAVAAIGHLPEGHGVLGTLIHRPVPVRVADIAAHPDAVGFPPHHPPMRSFLGVPVRVGDVAFGYLYLTEKQGAPEFTIEDQELVEALAGAAGTAVANARLHAKVRHRERTLGALQEVATALLAGTDPDDVLALVAGCACDLFGASAAVIALRGDDGAPLRVEVVAGDAGSELRGVSLPFEGSLSGHVLRTGETIVVADAAADPRVHRPMADALGAGPMAFVPLLLQERPFGAMALARAKGGAAFDDDDIVLLGSFAAQTSIALEHARSQRELSRLTLFEDQERIARELHDTVIQRLFAVGMGLQGAARMAPAGKLRIRLQRAVEDIDGTIGDIRATIFALDGTSQGSSSLRSQALTITADVAETYGLRYRFTTEGPVDTAVREEPGNELAAVLREAMSNVGRHAAATSVDVVIAATASDVVLRVRDDGVGMPAVVARRSGVRNMAERAVRLGGSCEVATAEGGGTLVEWRIPL